jgi:Bacterial regulatory proteins, tetR family
MGNVPCRRPGFAWCVVHRASQPEAGPSAGAGRLTKRVLVVSATVVLITLWLQGLQHADTLTLPCWVDVRPVTGQDWTSRLPGPRNRRDTLLRAALDGFTRRGYDGTSVAELATATGMSKAAVSYHFSTKNDLLHALVDPLLDGLDALIERHPQAPTWPDEVQALLDDYLTTLTEHSQVAAWVDTDRRF